MDLDKDIYFKFIKNLTEFAFHLSDNPEEYLRTKVCNEKYALQGQNNEINDHKVPCKIMKIPACFGLTWYAILLNKHSPFTKIFNKK